MASLDPKHPSLITSAGNLAYCLWRSGKSAEARLLFERALARAGDQPSLQRAHVLENYGLMLASDGVERDAGVARLRQSADERQKFWGPTHDKVLRARFNIALMQMIAGKNREALRETEAALAEVEKAGAANVSVPKLYDMQGSLSTQRLHRFDDAVQAHDAAMKVHQRLASPPGERANTLFHLSMAQVGLRRHADAIASLERSLELRAVGAVPPDERAQSLVQLARVLVLSGGDRGRACQLARDAAAGYREAGVHYQVHLGEVEQFLKKQRCR